MRRVIALSMPVQLAVILAGCGSSPPIARPATPVYCPLSVRTGGPATRAGFDARVLLGMMGGAASATASHHGCVTRVVRVDGKVQAGTADYRTDRLDLDLARGEVVAVRVG